MPALLAKDLLVGINIRVEHGIQIYVHQVLKILVVDAGHGIDRLIGIGHGIQKRIQGSLYQLHKRILHRKLPGSAEHRMLHDMRHAGTVRYRSPESDGKDLIAVVVGKQEQPGPAFFMTQDPGL